MSMKMTRCEFVHGMSCKEVCKFLAEIVRCKDCKRFIPQGTYKFNSGVVNKDSCEVIRGFVVQIDPDGFCAWGVKK